MENSNIDEIYKRYGYITKNVDGVLVYEYKQGRYFGVDIINNGNSTKIEQIKDDYRKLDFSTLVRNYTSIEEIEDELFKSFFQLSSFRTTLNRRYDAFIQKQMIGLPSSTQYCYIKSDYVYSSHDSDGIITSVKEIDNKSVVDHVSELLNTTEEPLFVIIEAAAGYGKTCTAYEIIKKMEEANTEILPFYIELSRNREARIFKHILQNEIDEQFQNVVKSDVVLHQIKQGKIPVIIDGFDELLSKDLSANTSQLRDIESMLSTIVNLLENKAKIVITSRKTAIFSGEDFYEWIRHTNKKYNVARFSISEPKIENWLNEERLGILNSSEFPISNVANPVLLSYIRNIDLEELKELVQNSKNIVDKYFEFLLSREQIRQELHFDEETQLRIFKKLVRIMTEFDIKSENKAFIKEILKDSNRSIFDTYIKYYPKLPKPTHDELADTLSNHALLDRKQHDNIGFINEFILGILIGRNLIEEKYQTHIKDFTKIITQEFAFLAISAFKVQPEKRRESLWTILNDNKFPYDDKFLFYRDLYLKNDFIENYSDILIEDISFNDIKFIKNSQFNHSIFSNCKFFSCTFDKHTFNSSGFINCKFYDCQWTVDSCYKEFNMYITGCESNNDFGSQLYEHEEQQVTQVDAEELFLKNFIKSASKVNSMKRLSTIKDSLKESGVNMREIEKAINSLKKNSYIVINGNTCFIQREGITYFNHKYSYEQ
ncbi:hypothetical protein FACS189426_03630 [Bacteroidia bacterium]|nr:hypothetical protein FACS189426_03630 [Bacteroidia bacterium]GHV71864.1 hypothetical protein FACS189420_8210 [Bacteroidia bacterium]